MVLFEHDGENTCPCDLFFPSWKRGINPLILGNACCAQLVVCNAQRTRVTRQCSTLLCKHNCILLLFCIDSHREMRLHYRSVKANVCVSGICMAVQTLYTHNLCRRAGFLLIATWNAEGSSKNKSIMTSPLKSWRPLRCLVFKLTAALRTSHPSSCIGVGTAA